MSELHFLPARKLARLIRTRKASAVEVVKAFIAQAERVNPKVNAIVTFLPEEALREARRADAALRRTASAAKPLAGLPIAYKDVIATRSRAPPVRTRWARAWEQPRVVWRQARRRDRLPAPLARSRAPW